MSLFVSPYYPPDRSDELQRAFEEAGKNLGIKVSICSSRDNTADQRSVLLLYPGFFRTKELKNLTIDLLIRKTNTSAPFLLYSTDMSADMSEHRHEGTRILGARIASQVFTPMWSAWPEVSSLQTVAAEEQMLRALSRAAEGKPDRASSQTVDLLEDYARERWKLVASSVAPSGAQGSSRAQPLLGGAGSSVGVQYVPEP